MSDEAARQRRLVIERAVQGPGSASPAQRRAAFDNQGVDERARRLVDKAARRAWTVTSEDVAAVSGAGMTDDTIFELVVCAALGQSTRQLDTALAALEEAAGTDNPTAAGQVRPHDGDGGGQ